MRVPRQVAEMEAECDKELEAQVAKPVENQPTGTPVAADAPNAEGAGNPAEPQAERKANLLAGVSVDDAARAEEERKQAAREASAAGRLRKLQGQLGAQREEYERKIAELEAKTSELEDKLKNVRVGNAPPVDDVTEDELFAKVRKEYSEDDYSDDDLKRFIGIIRRVSDFGMRPIQRRFEEMDAEREESSRRAAKAEADGFVKRLEAEFPGFREIDASNDPRWISFLDTSLGGVMEGTTYGDVAKDALKSLDYRKFSSVVREFAKQSNIVFSPGGKPADAGVMGQIRPATLTSRRQVSQKQPIVVPMAEIEEFRRAAFAHRAEERYGITSDEVRERLRFYEDAEAEGRAK